MKIRTNITISVAIGCAILAALALHEPNGAVPTLGMELVPAEEAGAIASSIALLQDRTKAFDSADITLRGHQPKHHGCVTAELAVVENLDPSLRVGVFQPGAHYAAWVRFSNHTGPQSDAEPDVRGIAIKVLDVPGEKHLQDASDNATQDFLLISHPVVPFRDARSFAQGLNAVIDENWMRFFFNPFDLHLRAKVIARDMLKPTADLLDLRWWSAVPYRFGLNRAVKYSLRPCTQSDAKAAPASSKNFLGERLQQRLASAGVCFEFMIQRQTDPATMPIEDPTTIWDERLAPFEPIALLTVPQQQLDLTNAQNSCTDLSFNAWRALAVHQPLGGVNRTQRQITQAFAGDVARHTDRY